MQLTVGKHKCRVLDSINGWFGESEKTGTPFIRLPLIIIEGECEGLEVEYRGYISHKAIKNTTQTLNKAFGFNGVLIDLAKLVSGGPFAGKECEITAEEEEYEDKKSVKIKWLNKVGASAKPLDRNRAMEIAIKFNTEAMQAISADTCQDADATAASQRAGSSELDVAPSDIPF